MYKKIIDFILKNLKYSHRELFNPQNIVLYNEKVNILLCLLRIICTPLSSEFYVTHGKNISIIVIHILKTS